MSPDEHDRFARWARIELNMPRAEFNSYTLVEFCDLVRLWKRKEQREEIRTGKICYAVATSSGATLKNGDPIPFDYFYPDYKPQKKARKSTSLLNQFLAAIKGANIIDLRKKPHGKK